MSSITLKLSSLVVRTLSKPIANQIKAQAREHERFRRLCVSFAQALHRVDMRLRLGLLRDTAAIERQAAKEAADAQSKKHKQSIPTVKTEAETLAEEAAAKNKEKKAEKTEKAPQRRIRPLSEAKAIDTGANFISETFLFLVGGGLIVFESWRSRRKESSRREDVAERLGELEEGEKTARRALVELEKEVLKLRAQNSTLGAKQQGRILPREVWELEQTEEKEDKEKTGGWLSRISGYLTLNKNEGSEGSNVSKPDSPTTASPVEKKVLSQDLKSPKDSGSRAEAPETPSTPVTTAIKRLTTATKSPSSSPKQEPPKEAKSS